MKYAGIAPVAAGVTADINEARDVVSAGAERLALTR
jgi:hypothetical protein